MKVYGQLEYGQFHNLTANPTAGKKGLVWFNTVDGKAYLDNGTINRNFLLNNGPVVGNSATAADNIRINRAAAGYLQFLTADDATAEGSKATTLFAQLDFKLASYTTVGRPASGNIGRLAYDTTFGKPIWDTGAAWTVVGDVTLTDTQTLTGKTLTGNIAVTLVSGAATITLPTTTGTLATLANSETFTNKTLTTPNLDLPVVRDTSDNTKKLNYSLSGATTAKTTTFTFVHTLDRAITFPNATDTLVGKATTDILTNKTLTTPIIDYLHMTDGSTPSTPSSGTTKIYSKTDGKVYKITSAGVEQELGAGASGGSINYISTNPDAETGTTGWATYKDAAAATPVDGTAGSPTLTFTRTTSSPLRSTGSFLVTTTAANLQGEGASYDFTLSRADFAKVMSISFDYEVASGTYATGDLAVYIYDVTNSTLIQPSGYQVQYIIGTAKHIATFQTSLTGTSYRLIIHRAVSTASAMTLKIDNVQLGPQIVQYSAPVTDWVAFTPTGTWITNTVYTGFWKRVGDMMYVQTKILCSGGAPTSATLTVNIPSGYTVDTAKLVQATSGRILPESSATIHDQGASTYFGEVCYSSTTAVALEYIATGNLGIEAAVTQAAPFTFGDTDNIIISYAIPITGWSSSVLMSNDTDTRIVSARYTGSAALNIASSSTPTIVNFSALVEDTHNAVTIGTSWKYTVSVPGDYRISACLDWGAYTNITSAALWVYKNGSAFARLQNLSGVTLASQQMGGTCKLTGLIAGDTFDVRAAQVDSGAATRAIDTTATHTFVDIERLCGPSAIAASENINSRVTNNVATTIATSGDTLIPYLTGTGVTWDTHGGWASSIYTVPAAGKYRVNAKVKLTDSQAFTVQDIIVLYAKVDNTTYYPLGSFNGLVTQTVNTGPVIGGSVDLSLIAGQTVKIVAIGTLTATKTTLTTQPNYTSCEIARIGYA